MRYISLSILITTLVLDHTGEVMLEIAANFRSSCNVDAKSFPFDRQTCTMLFMSWTQESDKVHDTQRSLRHGRSPTRSDAFSSPQVQMVLETDRDLELVAYTESAEFALESYTAVAKNHTDPCCIHPFSAVEYSVTITRRAMFFLVINYVLPMVVINVIGRSTGRAASIPSRPRAMFFLVIDYVLPMVVIDVIALLAFLVPCESGEKVTLGISTMLNMIIFLTSIRDLLPPTGQIPLIGKFYCVFICLVGLEVALSIFTLYLHHMEGIPLPKWMQNLCLILTKLPLMRQPKFIQKQDGSEKDKEKLEKENAKENAKKKEKEDTDGEVWAQRASFPLFFADVVLHRPREPSHEERHRNDKAERSGRVPARTELVEERAWERETGTRMARGRVSIGADLENWRMASKVLDRFFLYLFTLLNVAVSIGIMLYTPNS
ncbi:unnamed protein product [Darwinula stevensoni]|uniref:Uncharacterized protein n=1 Tax=Darwinula stevensoni TaxID=69355 RepID=A0A7R9FSW9_9CRUS|nr:unnamed protein product [Darwinula stevensoni]CAG0903452.1 unnamed protein product [Darwinula stevensoni]